MATTSKSKDAPLRLLLIDDSEDGAEQLRARFVEAGIVPDCRRVGTAAGLRRALQAQAWDALLCKHRLPGLGFAAALKLMQEAGFDLPFIVIVNHSDDKLAARAMRAGAHDCVARDRLDRLLPAVEREVRDARHRADHRAALEMLRESEARFRALASNLPGMVFQLQRDSAHQLRFVYVSEGCHKLFGFKQHELLSSPRRFLEAMDAADREALALALDDSAAHMTTLNWEGRMRSKGQTKWINLRSTPHRLDPAGIEWQGIATDITRSKNIEAAERRSREQMAELSFHLESVREEERERIARDIHDELGSILVALKIEAALLSGKLPALEATPPAGLREKAQAIDALIDRAMQTTGRVARELRPGILKEFGLPAAIESQAEDFAQRTGMSCRVLCDDGPEPDEKTSLALFRILQEALTNVAKHAHASLVVVRLRREKSKIVLEIRDNGRGISEADLTKPKSFGLRGIRERVNSLNGEFNVAAAEQGGSHLTLRVPDLRSAETPTATEEDVQQKLF